MIIKKEIACEKNEDSYARGQAAMLFGRNVVISGLNVVINAVISNRAGELLMEAY